MTEIKQPYLDEAERVLKPLWFEEVVQTHAATLQELAEYRARVEAMAQKVVKRTEIMGDEIRSDIREMVWPFLAPPPVDPLVAAIEELGDGRAGETSESYAACRRNALAKRGLAITVKEKGE